ncbi:MAG: phage holin family protein [Clostridia bacterium]|nr:phage holin family protein [Clostridia bacterium]
MRNEYLAAQGAVSAAVGWISARLGHLFWPLVILGIMMLVDYFSGMMASKAEAIRHPGDPAYGWSSRKGLLGILKKLGYGALIAVAVCLDLIILHGVTMMGLECPVKGLFGLIITVWLVLNEMLSVIENAGRMGVNVPSWLARYIAVLKGKIDEQYEPPEPPRGEEDSHEP